MRPTVIFAFLLILSSINAYAVDDSQSPIIKAPPRSMFGGEGGSPPMPPPPHAVESSETELTALLKAQTTAIRVLAKKLDSLDERIKKIEEREQ